MANDQAEIALLYKIGSIRRRLGEAESRAFLAKKRLEETDEWQDHKDARAECKDLKELLNGAVALTSDLAQLPLVMDDPVKEVLTEVAEQVNSGVLDMPGVKCHATVS